MSRTQVLMLQYTELKLLFIPSFITEFMTVGHNLATSLYDDKPQPDFLLLVLEHYKMSDSISAKPFLPSKRKHLATLHISLNSIHISTNYSCNTQYVVLTMKPRLSQRHLTIKFRF